jgi:oxidoreductase
VNETSVIRVALVGFGWAGRSIWLPRLLADPGYQVVAVVDPAPGLAASLGDPGIRALADQADLDPADLDLAVVAVPNHLHAEVASLLLHRGISVFVEKPVCVSSAQADRLTEAENSTPAVLLAGSASRYRRDVRALYDLVADLGPVRHVDLAWVRARGVPGRDGWFTQRELAGGGALVDLGWHLLDAAAPLLGSTTITQVVGSVSGDFLNQQGSRAAWRAEDGTPTVIGDVEDTARGFLLTETGVSMAIRSSWASHEALDRTEITVEAAGGTAILRCTFGFSPNRAGGSTLTHIVDGVTTVTSVGEPIGQEYEQQLAELPAILADPSSKGHALEDTRRTIDVIERLYRSASNTGLPSSSMIEIDDEMTSPLIDLTELAALDGVSVGRSAGSLAGVGRQR